MIQISLYYYSSFILLMANAMPQFSPSTDELEHSLLLRTFLKEEIKARGPLNFAQFMQHTLYAPGLGYYCAGKTKFNKHGDFITAPLISPLFSQCLAQQIAQIFSEIGVGDILEFGAGTGVMAADILLALETQNLLPAHYYILEVSPDLRQHQETYLQKRCPHLYSRISWLNQLPTHPITGVILANEVVDAMPVHRFYATTQEIKEYYVTYNQQEFKWLLDKPSDEGLTQSISQLQQQYFQEESKYESEINTYIAPWINSLSAILQQGAIFIIDYGFPAREYYHPERHMGTLMCHYQHHAHANPLVLIGLQDITAHVDFTAVALAAVSAGLHVAGYTTQAHFLLGCGLLNFLEIEMSVSQRMLTTQQVKKLLEPHEMGELFKTIALTRGIDFPLVSFSQRDLRSRL